MSDISKIYVYEKRAIMNEHRLKEERSRNSILNALELEEKMNLDALVKRLDSDGGYSRVPLCKLLKKMLNEKNPPIKESYVGKNRYFFLPQNEGKVSKSSDDGDYMRRRIRILCRRMNDRAIDQHYIEPSEQIYDLDQKMNVPRDYVPEIQRTRFRTEILDECIALFRMIEVYEKRKGSPFERPWGNRTLANDLNHMFETFWESDKYYPEIEEYYQFFFIVESELEQE